MRPMEADRYALNVTTYSGVFEDSTGTWLVHPDQQVGVKVRDASWFRRGLKLGLFDDRNILLVAGYDEGLLSARAYLLAAPGEPHEVECVFEKGGIGETLEQVALLCRTADGSVFQNVLLRPSTPTSGMHTTGGPARSPLCGGR